MLEIPKVQKRISSQPGDKIISPKSINISSKNNKQSYSANDESVIISNKKSVVYPQPVSSQGVSQELQYLSYLVNVIDQASQFSDQQSQNNHFNQAQYWHILYLSAIYVRKREKKTQIDDQLMMEVISDHFIVGVIIPQAKDEIGIQLLQNGYFLLSYALAIARTRQSKFVFRYLMNLFSQNNEIIDNQEEFFYYFDQYISKNQMSEIFIQTNQTPKQSTLSNENTQRGNKNSRPLQAIKLLPPDEGSSNYSRTIQLQQSQQQKSWC